MLELSLQTYFTTFCSRDTHYGTSSAVTLLVENIDSWKFKAITSEAAELSRIKDVRGWQFLTMKAAETL